MRSNGMGWVHPSGEKLIKKMEEKTSLKSFLRFSDVFLPLCLHENILRHEILNDFKEKKKNYEKRKSDKKKMMFESSDSVAFKQSRRKIEDEKLKINDQECEQFSLL